MLDVLQVSTVRSPIVVLGEMFDVDLGRVRRLVEARLQLPGNEATVDPLLRHADMGQRLQGDAAIVGQSLPHVGMDRPSHGGEAIVGLLPHLEVVEGVGIATPLYVEIPRHQIHQPEDVEAHLQDHMIARRSPMGNATVDAHHHERGVLI